MKNIVLDRIKNKLNWRERIIFRMFNKTYIKVYNIARIDTINYLLK